MEKSLSPIGKFLIYGIAILIVIFLYLKTTNFQKIIYVSITVLQFLIIFHLWSLENKLDRLLKN